MTYVMMYAGGTATSPRRTANYQLLKGNRTVVWILLSFMILLLVTGYGLMKPNLIDSRTGDLVDYWTALRLHTLLDVPLMIFFLIHVMVENQVFVDALGIQEPETTESAGVQARSNLFDFGPIC